MRLKVQVRNQEIFRSSVKAPNSPRKSFSYLNFFFSYIVYKLYFRTRTSLSRKSAFNHMAWPCSADGAAQLSWRWFVVIRTNEWMNSDIYNLE